MELPSHEGEVMPLPLNISYGGGHALLSQGHGHLIPHDHHHHHASHHHIIGPLPSNNLEDHDVAYKKRVTYKECLKNHAAAMGGNAIDGCGEFMPSGEEGTLEAFTCSACKCHRNFHRKQVEGEPTSCDFFFHSPHFTRVRRKVILGQPQQKANVGPDSLGYPTPTGALMGPLILPTDSDDQEDGGGGGGIGGRAPMVKKRFRTKFTKEQKEKMLHFAEKVGWKIGKQEESLVQQLCQEIGVKRRVLKVWVHNNKHNMGKKNNANTPLDQV